MTPTQVQDVLHIVARLFPRNKLTPPEMDNWGEALCRVEIDVKQAEAVIEQHRNEHDFHSPKLSVLLAKMTAAQQLKRISENTRTTKNRLVDHYRSQLKAPPHVSDLDVALRMAQLMRSDSRTDDQVRGHLITVLREFAERREAEDVAYDHYPDPDAYERIKASRERVDGMIAQHDASGGTLSMAAMLKKFTAGKTARYKAKEQA